MIKLSRQIWVLLIILILTILVYSPVLNAGFVNLDDNGYIYSNPDVVSGGFQSLTHFFSNFYVGHYLPLTMLSFKIDHVLFGLNAHGYHIVNLILHLINTILVFLLIQKLFREKQITLIITALFALHPMHVESVAWISERKDVLYSFFLILSLIYYLKYIMENNNPKYYYVSIITFVLALLSKSAAVVLPLILILTDFAINRKFEKKIILEKIPFFLIALLFAILTLFSQDVGGKGSEVFLRFSGFEKLIFAIYAFGFYIVKMIIPFHLSAYYPFPELHLGNLPDNFYFSMIVSILFLLIIIWLMYHSIKKRKFNPLLFGMLLYLITISLYIYLPVGRVIVAERFSYLSYLGLFFIIAFLINWLDIISKNRSYFRYIEIFLIIIALCFSFLSYSRTKVWKNGVSLWMNVINKYPEDPVVNKSLADAFVIYRNYDRALYYYNMAIARDPYYDEAYYNMGIMNLQNSHIFQSIHDFTKAVELNPGLVDGYINRGNARAQLKDLQGAITDYTLAIQKNPSKTEAYINRGSTWFLLNNTKQACADWQIAANLGSVQAKDMIEGYCK
jgi:protein O-mannosyl-transferase